LDWRILNLIEANELEYAKRRKLIDLELEREDYEPVITDVEFPGETAEEFYRREWLNEFRE
jgi:hypothetical protein